MKRGDDTEEKLQTRLDEFHNKTTPVLDYYGAKVRYTGLISIDYYYKLKYRNYAYDHCNGKVFQLQMLNQ